MYYSITSWSLRGCTNSKPTESLHKNTIEVLKKTFCDIATLTLFKSMNCWVVTTSKSCQNTQLQIACSICKVLRGPALTPLSDQTEGSQCPQHPIHWGHGRRWVRGVAQKGQLRPKCCGVQRQHTVGHTNALSHQNTPALQHLREGLRTNPTREND